MTPAAADTDADLLARYRAGDEAVLGPLFDRYEGPVFRFLLGLLRDRHEAEDALQETFVCVLRFADAPAPGAFRGWLFTVAHRRAMLARRKGKRVPAPAADLLELVAAGGDEPDAAAARTDDARVLAELLAGLPAGQRDVIRLRVYDGLKFREVAARLGCPLNTALARMHDGLKTLRHQWDLRHA